MSTIASNSAVLGGHCTVVLGLEHAKTIAKSGWSRSDIRHYLWMNSGNAFRAISRDHRYGKVYNRNLPKWLKRDPDSRIPIVPSADNIHLFIMGGHAGRFSAFHSRLGSYEHTGARADQSYRRPGRRRMHRRRMRALKAGGN
jgi:hypothetical protein